MAPKLIIKGTITCEPDDIETVLAVLPSHIITTRAEPGCLEFSITQCDENPCVFHVAEKFLDQAAFDMHGARTRASIWWDKTKHIPRDLTVTET